MYKKSYKNFSPRVAATGPIIEGVLDCKGDRFGFLPYAGDEDVFIPGKELNGARHGDTVRAIVVSERPGRYGKRREGRVLETVEKNAAPVVATIIYDGRYYAVPDDRAYGDRLDAVYLGGASVNDKVVIRVIPHDIGDKAEVLSVIGRVDEIGVDVMSVIAAHSLRTEFPKDVTEEAEAFADAIDEKEARSNTRTDFRTETVVTIDGSDSKDFDDAVSLIRYNDGYRLGVYIADVAEYVKEGSALDREAFARGTSVYLADRVIPMLPEKLSNGLCSLNEGEDRLVLAVIADLDATGKVLSYEVKEGVIRSSARLTYDGVQKMLDGDKALRKKYGDIADMLDLMKELAAKRIKLREKRGSVDFKLTESEIVFDAAGHVADIRKKPALMSMKIIEEFMILANCAVAEKFAKLKTPFVYRAHERPAPAKVEALNDYLDALGLSLTCPYNPEPKQVATLLEKAEKLMPSAAGAISHVALRSMAKAEYTPFNEGHFGLAEKYYCHFTSPIRRYPDLCIHRIIKAYLNGGAAATKKYKDFTVAAAEKSSAAERVAQECERKVDDLKKAEYMKGHIGETFAGVISSVTEFGFFVELENSAEGLVAINKLPPAAKFDPKRLAIFCGMKKYGLGEPVDIVVVKVEGDRIDFSLV